jgi:hypothetical protein
LAFIMDRGGGECLHGALFRGYIDLEVECNLSNKISLLKFQQDFEQG